VTPSASCSTLGSPAPADPPEACPWHRVCRGSGHDTQRPRIQRPESSRPALSSRRSLDGSGVTSPSSPRTPPAWNCACSTATARRGPRDREHGPVWHVYLLRRGPEHATLSGARPWDPANGHRFNPAKLLLDPYARAIDGTITWGDSLFAYESAPVRARRRRSTSTTAPSRCRRVSWWTRHLPGAATGHAHAVERDADLRAPRQGFTQRTPMCRRRCAGPTRG